MGSEQLGWEQKVDQAVDHITRKIAARPEVGLILGSGLGDLVDQIPAPEVIEYQEIPHFPQSTVEGHKGQLVFGNLAGKNMVAMQGRFHIYEGYSMFEITFPVRVMKRLGIEVIIITNACGGLNPGFSPGLLMFISDHLNFTGNNPLIGPNLESFGTRFPDMSQAYPPQLIELGNEVAKQLEVETRTGVHSAVSGPYYLSRAELSMVRKLGADTIGMSTIPETIVAVHCGLRVLGICCITDMAVPDSLISIDHEEVMRVANLAKPKFIQLVTGILERL